MTPDQIRKRNRDYMRAVYRNNPEYRAKVLAYSREYASRPEVQARRKQRREHELASRPAMQRPQISPEHLAYAAGIIDGEGTIQIKKAKGHNREINDRYELVIQVTNTDPKMIVFFLATFGGSRLQGTKRKKPHWRQDYRWHIAGRTAEWFLGVIRPYLVCKTNQADLGLDFRTSFHQTRNCRLGVPPEVMKFRHECFLAMKALHRESWDNYEFATGSTGNG